MSGCGCHGNVLIPKPPVFKPATITTTGETNTLTITPATTNNPCRNIYDIKLNLEEKTDDDQAASIAGLSTAIGNINSDITDIEGDIAANAAGIAEINNLKGAINGFAMLDDAGLVSVSQLTNLFYQGTWDATLNTPLLESGVGVKGQYYTVSVAGITDLDGITDWKVKDQAIFNGTIWEKIDNTDAVTSVAGHTGDVTLAIADIALLQVELAAKASQTALDDTNDALGDTNQLLGDHLDDTAKHFTINDDATLVPVGVQTVAEALAAAQGVVFSAAKVLEHTNNSDLHVEINDSATINSPGNALAAAAVVFSAAKVLAHTTDSDIHISINDNATITETLLEAEYAETVVLSAAKVLEHTNNSGLHFPIDDTGSNTNQGEVVLSAHKVNAALNLKANVTALSDHTTAVGLHFPILDGTTASGSVWSSSEVSGRLSTKADQSALNATNSQVAVNRHDIQFFNMTPVDSVTSTTATLNLSASDVLSRFIILDSSYTGNSFRVLPSPTALVTAMQLIAPVVIGDTFVVNFVSIELHATRSISIMDQSLVNLAEIFSIKHPVTGNVIGGGSAQILIRITGVSTPSYTAYRIA